MTLMQIRQMIIVPRYADRSLDWLLKMTFFFGLCLTALLMSPSTNALTNARIVLHDGSSIVADIVDYRGDQITLSTSFSRDLKIDTALIKDIQASADDREISTYVLVRCLPRTTDAL